MFACIGLPQFSTIQTVGFKENLQALLEGHLQRIDTLLKENRRYTWENLIVPLEDLDDSFDQLWSPLSHLHGVMDSKDLRECYEACLPIISDYEAKIGHNQKLYEAIESIDTAPLDDAQKKIIEDNLLAFKLSGVALSKENKKRFEKIQARLSELSNKFENNVLDARQAFILHLEDDKRLGGLPEHALDTAKELAEEQGVKGYTLTLESPCFQAVITYADDRSLREQFYQAYVTLASDQGSNAGKYDNSDLINEILSLRHEKAQLLGYGNYAELSLAPKMAESTAVVMDYLEQLVAKIQKQAKKEFKELNQFAADFCGLKTLKPWDLAYVSEKRRQALYQLSQEELRPYFSLPKVMHGLFSIVNKLYGMKIEEVPGVDVWHKDVCCYCIVDKHNQVRGFIYTDLFARKHKHSGAWMDSIQSRREFLNGQVQYPIATLTCNFAKPSANKPATLSHDELLTLFHEFGHCLHHVLTQVGYLDASGINGVEWDAVELPSQFFENWCWDQESLTLLSGHVNTGAVLPKELFERLLAIKNFQSAMAMMRQMELALFDFRIHLEFDQKKEQQVADILSDVRAKTSLLTPMPYNRFQHSFSHVFCGGYAAGYYSYSWAEVLSSDAFARFEEEGLFNPKTGQDFLHSILEQGGAKKAKDAYREFRGRDATIDALLRHNGISG